MTKFIFSLICATLSAILNGMTLYDYVKEKKIKGIILCSIWIGIMIFIIILDLIKLGGMI